MRAGHFFCGAGGNLLAGRILGWNSVLAVEWDDYRCDVLEDRRAGWWPGLHVHRGDIRLFDPSEWRGRLDLVTASWPCTDISVAGNGAGLAGDESGLYFPARDAIRVIRPRYVFYENSPAICHGRGLTQVLCDLADMGYDARWCCVGAEAIGAPHVRDRWWLLGRLADADAEGELQQGWSEHNFWGRTGDGAAQALADLDQEREQDGGAYGNGQPTLATAVGGPLSPTWCHWFMGWPIGFLRLKRWETPGAPSKRRSRGSRSAAPPPPAGA